MNTQGTEEKSFPALAAAAAALALAVIAGGYVLTGGRTSPEDGTDGAPRVLDTLAVVGEEVLGREEFLLSGGSPGALDAWIEDELLAQLAVERGLENPVMTGFAMRRARQLCLRDALLASELARTVPPGYDEMLRMMQTDPALYLVERHYFEMLVADSLVADSLRARLAAGQGFQVTAENVSLGQKAALGGDMGFLVGGELTGRGLPDEIGRLEGLSEVIESDLGWHIFLVTETRPLTDTARVVASLQQVFLEQRRRDMVENLLAQARQGRVCHSNEGILP